MSGLTEQFAALEAALAEPPSEETRTLIARLSAPFFAVDAASPEAARACAFRVMNLLANHHSNEVDLVAFSAALTHARTLAATLGPALHVQGMLRAAEGDMTIGNTADALDNVAAALVQLNAGDTALRTMEVMARAYRIYAAVLTEAGLFTHADAMYQRALAQIGNEAMPEVRSSIWSARMGLIFTRASIAGEIDDAHYREAVHAFEEAVQCAAGGATSLGARMLSVAYTNRVLLELLSGHVDLAAQHLPLLATASAKAPRTQWLCELATAFVALCRHNGAAERAAVDELLTPARVASTQWRGESLGVLASLFTHMGDGENAARAFDRRTEIRTQTLWATLLKPIALPASPTPATPINAPMLDLHSMDLLERLAITAELRDDDTGKHCYRVGRLTKLLTARAGADEAQSDLFGYAARLHDIGKFAIPDAILLKPGKLTAAEQTLMRRHTLIGGDLLTRGDGEVLKVSSQIARHHHEWWDGSGYPARLAGEAIPFVARAVCIVDVYDALTHKRAYKPAWSHDDAMRYIIEKRGVQFDPQLTDHFVALMEGARASWRQFIESLEFGAADSPLALAEQSLEGLARR
jgi:HD-GYP domain-containing protein (c-di-GMP phosphodiesterase class II)